MTRTVYLDEIKTPTYLMAAVVAGPSAMKPCREELRRLRVPGTARVHFHTEQDRVRKVFIATVAELVAARDLTIRLYSADQGRELQRRAAILERVVFDCAQDDVTRLVLEMDASTRKHDEAVIKEARWKAGIHATLRYDVIEAAGEPLLWIADAVAWAWRRDRQWQNRVRPLVQDIIRV